MRDAGGWYKELVVPLGRLDVTGVGGVERGLVWGTKMCLGETYKCIDGLLNGLPV